jgi:polyisoprenoid-binding protein YceI
MWNSTEVLLLRTKNKIVIMKKTGIILVAALLLCTTFIAAQGKYFTKSGKISFFSSTQLEDIEAVNRSVSVVVDSKTGDVQFSVLIKGFEFKKALMQEHFNDRHMESDKYPQSTFKGKIINNNDIKYSQNGTYSAKVKGMLTIHGVTQEIETTGTVTVKDGKIHTNSVFNISLADYKVTHTNKVSNTIKITVDCPLDPLG